MARIDSSPHAPRDERGLEFGTLDAGARAEASARRSAAVGPPQRRQPPRRHDGAHSPSHHGMRFCRRLLQHMMDVHALRHHRHACARSIPADPHPAARRSSGLLRHQWTSQRPRPPPPQGLHQPPRPRAPTPSSHRPPADRVRRAWAHEGATSVQFVAKHRERRTSDSSSSPPSPSCAGRRVPRRRPRAPRPLPAAAAACRRVRPCPIAGATSRPGAWRVRMSSCPAQRPSPRVTPARCSATG